MGPSALVIYSVALSVASNLAKGDPIRPRILIGGAFLLIALGAIAGPAPKLAFGLAAVMAITASVTAGPDVIRRLAPN